MFIGPQSWLAARMTIGNFVMFAGRVATVGGDHTFSTPGTPMIECERGESELVVIEDDVWIGHGAILMHGIRVGEGAIVAAGSVVTKEVLPYIIVGGIPARQIGVRFEETSDIETHRDALAKRRKNL